MTTHIIPAIDLRDGRVVRLRQGDFDRQTTFDFNPVRLAGTYAAEGATWVHVVDLDGARSGRFENLDVIAAIAANGMHVQAGGGVRDIAGLNRLFDVGVSRAVVGSIAVREPETVKSWIGRYGAERLTLALDTRLRDGVWTLPSAGWTESESHALDELAPWYAAAGARHLLCTDIDRDGMMVGPNLELYTHLARIAPSLAVQASGGMRSAEDVAMIGLAGLAGVILGRALLEGALTVSTALAAL
jgi:phosphoribosylformimino-5-aminoimidazole carboxamide ribotide isomerase